MLKTLIFSLRFSSWGPIPTSRNVRIAGITRRMNRGTCRQGTYLPHIIHKLIPLSGRTWKRPSNIFLGPMWTTKLVKQTYVAHTLAVQTQALSPFHSSDDSTPTCEADVTVYICSHCNVTYTDIWPAKHFHLEFAGRGLNELLVLP